MQHEDHRLLHGVTAGIKAPHPQARAFLTTTLHRSSSKMASKDTSNFFNSATYDEEYWNIYLEARPEYSQAFYESVYGYHESHSGLTEMALDIGTGPGQVAAELSTHFHHVIASDNNITHLEVAQHRLGSLISSHNVELLQCAGEEVAQHIQPSSVDLVAAAECMPLMDAEKAIDAFAKVLKPNGTLAVWFYGRPYFAEPEFKDQCQTVLEKILDISYMRIVKGGGPQHKLGW
jgi:SAM-dependent methyltransferase